MTRLASWVLLLVLLINVLAVAFFVQPAAAVETTYIRADGSIDPPTAPISTSDNITYTFTANLTGSIVVQRSDIIIQGNQNTLQGSGSQNGFELINVNNITIRDVHIRNLNRGINVCQSSNDTILTNIITSCNDGIHLTFPSSYLNISKNRIADNAGTGIALTGSSMHNVISRNEIVGNPYGVTFSGSSLNSLSSNNISGSSVSGINLYGSCDNFLSENVAEDCKYGVWIGYSSDRNVLHRNNVTESEYGAYVYQSTGNVLRENALTSSQHNLGVYGESTSRFVQDVDTSNTVNGRPVYYWFNHHDSIIPSDAGFVALVSSSNITIRQLDLRRNCQGILLANATKVTIESSNVTENDAGVYFFRSSGNSAIGNYIMHNRTGVWLLGYCDSNTFSGNCIANNGYHGVYLYPCCSGNVFSSNSVSNNTYWGFYFQQSSNNTISENNVTQNFQGIVLSTLSCNNTLSQNNIAHNHVYGIRAEECAGNQIVGNNMTNNNHGILLSSSRHNNVSANQIAEQNTCGIYLYSSDSNNLFENDLLNNNIGIYIHQSSSNVLCHNNFLGNGQQVSIPSVGCPNYWNMSYPFGGNYWSDYGGSDLFSSPFQNETGSDGLGDMQRILDGNNADRYPLVNPWPRSYAFVTYFNLKGAISSNFTLSETVSVSSGMILNGTVTGDLEGFLNFTSLYLMTIETGSFQNHGYIVSNWTAKMENRTLEGVFTAFQHLNVNGTRVLSCAFSGDLEGIASGSISVSGGGVYDRFQATCRMNRIKHDFYSATIEIGGTILYENISTYTNAQVCFWQTTMNGTAWGYYTGPLNAVVTSVKIDDKNTTHLEGFSRISYDSTIGPGEGWTVDEIVPVGASRLIGASFDPLPGIVHAMLKHSQSPVILTGTIVQANDDDVGSPFRPDLKVRIWANSRVSPGETLQYVIEYRNDGLGEAADVVVFNELGPWVEYESGSNGAQYSPTAHLVSWRIGKIPAKSVGYLEFKAKAAWGLPQDLELINNAYIADTESTENSACKGRFATGIMTDTSNDGLVCNVKKLCEAIGVDPVFVFDQTDPFTGPLDVYAAMHDVPTYTNGLDNPMLRGYQPNWIGYSGSTRTLVTLAKKGLVWGENLYLLSPMGVSNSELAAIRHLTEQGKGFKNIYVLTGDDLLPWWWLGGVSVNFEAKSIRITPFSPNVPTWFDVEEPVPLLLTQFEREIWDVLGRRPRSAVIDTRTPGNMFAIEWEDGETETFYLQRDRDNGGEFLEGDGVYVLSIDGICHSQYKETLIEFARRYERLPWQGDLGLLQEAFDYTRTRADKKHVNWIHVAHDPNEKEVCPEDFVLKGQILNYTVQYENEGEGTAFGVYITDTLDRNLNASTLVIDANATYDPSTRTVTWLIGEVGPHENGSVMFNVNANDNLLENAEIINFATVHFLSVPETTRTNGVVNTIVCAHDVAALNVISSKTVVGEGYSAFLNVTVQNQGLNNETFNVTVYANTTLISSQIISLASRNYATMVFAWNTSGFAKGNYTYSAYAWPVPGETDATDNLLTEGWVFVSIPGDINTDRKVDLKDVFAVGKGFGSNRGSDGLYWHSPVKSCCLHSPNCDINDDGKIDLKDYYTTCKNYGESWPP